MDDYFDTGSVPNLEKDEDPFWDPPEAQLIGRAYYSLAHLANLFDNPHEAKIIDATKMTNAGTIKVNIVPTDEDGEAEESPLADEMESPDDLIGKRIDFNIKIENAQGLPNDLCRDPFVKYQFFDDPKQETPKIEGVQPSPVFDYKKHYTVDEVSPAMV